MLKIKRNPLVLSILTKGLLYYCGFVLAVASVILYVFSGSTASFLLTIPAAAFIYAGVKSPNILKGYKSAGYWKYEIITAK